MGRDSVLLDTAIVSAFTMLAKILGAAKSVAFARVYGAGSVLDSYLLAFLLPSFLADVFCGTLIPAVVPAIVELEHREGRQATIGLYARLMRQGLLFSTAAAAIFALVACAIAAYGGGGSLNLPLIGRLTLLLLPMLPLASVANVWRAILNARRNFAIPAVTATLTPAVVIVAVLMCGASGGAYVLAVATTAAYLAEAMVLGFAVQRSGFPLFPLGGNRRASLRQIGEQYTFLTATTGITAATAFIGQSMAASLGVGSVSALNYGTKLAAVLLAIGPAALAVTILPRFSEMVARRDWDRLRETLRRILFWSFTGGAVLTIVLIVGSSRIIGFTLQGGAFNAADTRIVARIQMFSLLQLPFVPGIAILMRVLSALRANRVLLPYSGVALLLTVALNYFLMNRTGVAGIALASSLAQAFLFICLARLVFREQQKCQETIA